MMRTVPQLLIYASPEAKQAVNHNLLTAAGCIVSTVSQPQEVDPWLARYPHNAILIIADPSAAEGLQYAGQLLKNHSGLPVILVTQDINQGLLKQGLEVGLVDYLTIPVSEAALLFALEHALSDLAAMQGSDLFERVLDQQADGVILAGTDGRLLLVNLAARQILNLESTNLAGKLASEVFDYPDLLECIKSRDQFPYHREIPLNDGRVFNAIASSIPDVGIVVVMQNITHLKELDRIKTDFVNTITHDLRSPLTAIYGFVGLIDRVGPVTEQQAEFIRHIQTSVSHITSLVNDLMDLGHLEASYDIHMEEVNLGEIIHRSLENLDYQVNAKMQELVLNLPQTFPLILGNSLHLQRMVTNLVENAIKFTPALGRISVGCHTEGNQLILEVSDNGPGIPLEDQPFIFDKFYRGSNMVRDVPGTGLGLSIVKTIVDRHHGRIWLDSSPLGTTFTVILPVR